MMAAYHFSPFAIPAAATAVALVLFAATVVRHFSRTGSSLFRQGFLSAVTNPKGLLFFAAFLPQFVDPARGLLGQFAIMAGTFALIEVLTEWVIASAAHRIRPWLRRTGRRFNKACGGIFVAIGAALPLRG